MQSALDRLLTQHGSLIRKKRVGVLAHPASIDKQFRSILQVLREEASCEIAALFGPEHGFAGEAQDMESVQGGTYQGIPVYSLYGSDLESLAPQPAWLQNLDLLICDLQDVGARYYTFIYTLAFCMKVAGKMGLPVLVLDRPNPINGHQVEGNGIGDVFRSFVGYYNLANRHGMSIGELAGLFNEEYDLGCDLKVLPMKGWQRRRYFDELDLPWVLPSPNMPSVNTAVVYPGMCLLEGTELSEGRGTTLPFELFGAPYIDPEKLYRRLKDFKLPGVRFRPTFFKPKFQKYANQVCGGAQIHVTRRKAFKALLTGVAVIKAVQELYPNDFQYRERAYEFVEDIPAIDLLAGSDQLRKQLEQGDSLKQIESSWEEERQDFLDLRKTYLLYS